MSSVAVSVVIPAKNGGRLLLSVVSAVLGQRCPRKFEVIVVDSGSTDDTLDVLRNGPVRLLSVPAAAFNHGATRNYAVGMARGELVVLLVQDALPDSPYWLHNLVQALAADESAAGAYCRQRPWPHHPAFVRRQLESWVTASDQPRAQSLTAVDYERMSAMERQTAVTFDDVASAIRKSVWRDEPFAEMSFAEDLDWSRRVLLAGHRILYVPESCVIHSHDRGPWYELRRTYVCHRTLNQLFGTKLVPDRRSMVRAMTSTVAHNRQLVRADSVTGLRRARHMQRAVGCAVASVAGQYLGPRASPVWDRILGRGV